MKKTLLIRTALILLPLGVASSAARAQDATGFRLGVKFGGTYSNVSGDDVKQFTGANYSTDLGDYKLGYNAGVGIQIPVSSDGFFVIAPELLYNRKGYEITSDRNTGFAAGSNISSIEIEQQRVLHYVDLPILARINAGGLFFELGPQVSYLFGSKNKSQTTTKFSNGDKDKVENDGQFQTYLGTLLDNSEKSDLSNVDISGVAGIGYQLTSGLNFSLRYARGFNSIIDSKNSDNEPKVFNNAFTLQAGYLFQFGK
ncbi:porin family protein [uncultured Hymenobacter sp.]|uniref:porin family protein n=1 Tax=uncultured Hymenobacter sp. TaxID=170016 RepID=UPI0035CA4073